MTERISRISSHFVVSELAAFPFSSEGAFRTGPSRLCSRLEGSTGELWRKAESTILGAVPSLSLDEFVARRDALWFQAGHGEVQSDEDEIDRPVPLLTVLRRLAHRALEVTGSVARPRLADGEFIGHNDHPAQHARNFWKWLSLSIPPDLLLAGLGGGVTAIETISPALDRRLRDDGFAEIHLHYGAGINFSEFWAATCGALLGITSQPEHIFASPGAALSEGQEFSDWLLRACLARYVMARFLKEHIATSSFGAYIESLWVSIAGELGLATSLIVQGVFSELRRGVLSEGPAHAFFELQQAFAHLRLRWCGVFTQPEDALDPVIDWSSQWAGARALDDSDVRGCNCDWSSHWAALDDSDVRGCNCAIPPEGRARAVELDFLVRAFAYLESEQGKGDGWFADCFWQSVRIRCLLYRHVTQRPMTPGLPWFLRTFARVRPGKRHLSARTRMILAARESGSGRGLRSLELRTSPEAEASEILEQAKASQTLREELVEEIGIVLHLVRDRGDGLVKGKPAAREIGGHADPSKDNYAHGARYGQWYREKKQEVFAFGSVLRDFPEYLKIIRGVDLCADEAGIPTWVVKPLFRYLRDTARNTAQAYSSAGQPALTLRTTIHAGEDWLHLLAGLRRMDEAREHFEMSAGDRFGHGLALAIDPTRWAADCGPIAMARELRLFDLAWVWRLRDRVDFSTVAVETELRRRMHEMFGPGAADAWLAQEFVEQLHDESVLHRVGYPSFVELPEHTDCCSPTAEELVRRYLADVRCFRRGRTIIHVDPIREGQLITAVQDWLRREIDSRGLVIEVNPSSNFLTQQLPNMMQHPVWRLHHGRHDGLPQLPVVIGSDDPITFATTLPEEYQLMHDALVLGGRTNAEADRWLDEVRRNSMLYRWTLPKAEFEASRVGYAGVWADVFLPP